MALTTRRPARAMLVVLAATATLALYVAAQDHPLDKPCSTHLRSTRPVLVTLSPSLLQHQSWVGIPEQELVDDTYIFACANGLVVGKMHTDHIELDPQT